MVFSVEVYKYQELELKFLHSLMLFILMMGHFKQELAARQILITAYVVKIEYWLLNFTLSVIRGLRRTLPLLKVHNQ